MAPSSTERREREPGKRLYDTRRWRRERLEHLREHPLCVECLPHVTALATEVDHVKPHRGDETLFWDRSNWRSLCARHHGRKTRQQQVERWSRLRHEFGA